MDKLAILRQQHDTAIHMAQRLLELIDQHRPGEPAFPILMQLNRLYGVIRLHLAYENVELYPAMIGCDDDQVAGTARRYMEEMGGLALWIECFARHWSCAASIAAQFTEFREAANELVLALAARIDRENLCLYPLAEEVVGQAGQRTAA